MSKLKSDYPGNIMKLKSLIDNCNENMLQNMVTWDVFQDIFDWDIKSVLKSFITIIPDNIRLNEFYNKLLDISKENNNNDDRMHLLDINDNILYKSLQYLDIKSIMNFEKVNRETCYIARTPIIYTNIALNIDRLPRRLLFNSKRCALATKIIGYFLTKDISIEFPKINQLDTIHLSQNVLECEDIKALNVNYIDINEAMVDDQLLFLSKLYILKTGYIVWPNSLDISNYMNAFRNLNIKSFCCMAEGMRIENKNISLIPYNIIKYSRNNLTELLLDTTLFNAINETGNESIPLNNLEELSVYDVGMDLPNTSTIKCPNIKRCYIQFNCPNLLSKLVNHTLLLHKHLHVLIIEINLNGCPMNELSKIITNNATKMNLVILFENKELYWHWFNTYKNIIQQMKKLFHIYFQFKTNYTEIAEFTRNYNILFDNMELNYINETEIKLSLYNDTFTGHNISWYNNVVIFPQIPVYKYNNINLYRPNCANIYCHDI